MGSGKIILDPTQAQIPPDPDPDGREYIPGKDCPASEHLDGAVYSFKYNTEYCDLYGKCSND